MKFIFTGLMLIAVQFLGAQTNSLDLDQFMRQLLQHHPLSRKADLLPLEAQALEKMQRGSFDPKIYGNWDQKSFDGKNYFRQGEWGIKSKTTLGIEVKTGYTVANGTFLNPENQLPEIGQAYAGVTVPLLQGLFIDGERAALREALLQADINQFQRQQLRNDLALEGLATFIQWSVTTRQLAIAEQAAELTRLRLSDVVESFRQGDKPALDTLETFIQWQTQLARANELQQQLQKDRLAAANFIWEPNMQSIPANNLDSQSPGVDSYLASTFPNLSGAQHPAILEKEVKIEQINIQERWATEQLKPRIDVSYNLLGRGIDFANTPKNAEAGLGSLFSQNYKWGVTAGFPIFLRKERGKLDLTRIKRQQVEQELFDKQRTIANKVEATLQQLRLLREQLILQQQTVNNYEILLQAELRKQAVGESSVFLINSREQKLLDNRLKQIALEGKYIINYYQLFWAAGNLAEQFN